MHIAYLTDGHIRLAPDGDNGMGKLWSVAEATKLYGTLTSPQIHLHASTIPYTNSMHCNHDI
jgi:hypothetical protein